MRSHTPEHRKSHFTSLQLLHGSGPCTNTEEMRLEALLTKDGKPRTSHFPISTVEDINSWAPLPCVEVSPPQKQCAVRTCAEARAGPASVSTAPWSHTYRLSGFVTAGFQEITFVNQKQCNTIGSLSTSHLEDK